MASTSKLDKRVRRSEAAQIIGVGPRSLRRYEVRGILPGIRLNSRMTVYRLVDVLRIANGEVSTGDGAPPELGRGDKGEFTTKEAA